MQPRKSTLGRPSGTDGSDFSYRMVVDSRYTKVAQGKSRLRTLIISQAALQLIGVLYILLFPTKEQGFDKLTILSIIISFISLIIGELGRRHSKQNLLRLYLVTSSFMALLSVVCFIKNYISLEVTARQSGWVTQKFDIIEAGCTLLGAILQIFAMTNTVSLVRNMTPPKRAV